MALPGEGKGLGNMYLGIMSLLEGESLVGGEKGDVSTTSILGDGWFSNNTTGLLYVGSSNEVIALSSWAGGEEVSTAISELYVLVSTMCAVSGMSELDKENNSPSETSANNNPYTTRQLLMEPVAAIFIPFRRARCLWLFLYGGFSCRQLSI